jgi:hypothetical protein
MKKPFSISYWPWAGIPVEAQPTRPLPPPCDRSLVAQTMAHSAQLADTANQLGCRALTCDANLIRPAKQVSNPIDLKSDSNP